MFITHLMDLANLWSLKKLRLKFLKEIALSSPSLSLVIQMYLFIRSKNINGKLSLLVKLLPKILDLAVFGTDVISAFIGPIFSRLLTSILNPLTNEQSQKRCRAVSGNV